MNPYIGDRQLDPDDDWECPYCEQLFVTNPALMRHVSRCAENPNVDLEDDHAQECSSSSKF